MSVKEYVKGKKQLSGKYRLPGHDYPWRKYLNNPQSKICNRKNYWEALKLENTKKTNLKIKIRIRK